MKVEEIKDKMNLSILDRRWHLQASCAMSGQGLAEGLTWMANQFKNRKIL